MYNFRDNMNEYYSKNRHKYYLKEHLIFAYKYRKPLLVGKANLETIRSILKIKVNGIHPIN